MKEFYAEVETKNIDYSKVGAVCNSKLKYYITKEEAYGIEIVKEDIKENSVSKESKCIINITKDKKKIKDILNILVDRKILPYVAEDIIKDIAI